MPDSIDDLALALRRFAEERDWGPFHSPKNLASALVVEAGELLEPFQWLSEDE
nr:nucleotide pyrophosphohydrolase [Ideonella sp.]